MNGMIQFNKGLVPIIWIKRTDLAFEHRKGWQEKAYGQQNWQCPDQSPPSMSNERMRSDKIDRRIWLVDGKANQKGEHRNHENSDPLEKQIGDYSLRR